MNNKKTFRKAAISTMAASAAVAAVAPVASAAETTGFPDVTKESVPSHYDAIMALTGADIIKGMPDGNFHPWEDVSRAQVAAMLTNALSLDIPADLDEALEEYTDLDADSEYAEQVAAVTEAGIFKGNLLGKFQPYTPITREQMATVLVKGLDLADYDKGEDVELNLENITPDHAENVQVLANLGITVELDDFRAYENITRAAFSTMLNKSLNFTQDEGNELGVTSVNASANKDHTVTVTGKVTNADRVTVTIDGVEKTAVLSEDGSYTFTSEALAAGTYEVTATAYKGDDSVSKTTKVAVVDEATSIAGFVLNSDGEGVSGATVSVNGEKFTTNSDGFYQVKNLDSDKFYDLSITKPEHAAQSERVRVEKDRVSSVVTENFDQIFQANITINGSVVDKVTGADLTTAQVELQAYHDELGEWVSISEEESVDAEGKYSFSQADVEPGDFLEFGGNYRVVVLAGDYHAGSAEVTVNENKEATGVKTVQLDPVKETTITGKVTRDDSAVGSATVNVMNEFGIVVASANTDANGNYKIDKEKLPSGDYNLSVKYTAGAGEETVTTKAITVDEGTNLSGQNVELALGTDFTFKLSAPVSKNIDETGLNAVVYNADGAKVAETTEFNEVKGDYVFEFGNNLSAGKYTVVTSGNHIVTKDYTFEVTAKDVADYVDNDTIKNVTGEQYEAVLGGALPGISNAVNVDTPGDSIVVVKDANGKEVARTIAGTGFDVNGVLPGKYTVDVYKPGYELDKESSNKVSVTVQENKDVEYEAGDLQLVVPNNTATIQGLIRSASSLNEITDGTVSFYQEGSLVEVATAAEYKDGVSLEPGIYTAVVRDHVDGNNDNLEYVTHVEQVTLNSKEEVENHHMDLKAGAAQIDLSVVKGDNKELEANTITIYDAWADRDSADENAGIITFTGSSSELVDDLSTGEFDIEVKATDYQTQTLGVSLVNKQDLTTKIVMSENDATYGVTVNTAVKGSTAPVSADKVVVFDAQGNIVAINGTGEFNLANGDYKVGAYIDGYYVSSQDITVNREDQTVLLEVEEGNWTSK